MKLLDLFCCAGGASAGYAQLGFEVVGVDIERQHHYPYEFIRADALKVLRDRKFLRQFDAIHASPPCQAHTKAQVIMNNEHPELIEPTRELLIKSGKPWIIENVVGAPLIDPIMLCGAMFPELNVYRHRLFEANFPLWAPPDPPHLEKQTKMGRPPQPGERMYVVGNFSGVQAAREAMGIDWNMGRNYLREAIPPAYSRFVGKQLIEHLEK